MIINTPQTNYDHNTIKTNIQLSKSHLDKIPANLVHHREKFLIDQATAIEIQGNLSRVKYLKELKHFEYV